jgi:prepilin-type N-terminal cleavage/methylation domain-containing protein
MPKSKTFTEGFTLIELMVSIGIIGLITTIVVFNQSDLSDQISLTNTASEIELQLREVQAYGISVREFRPGSDEFSQAYGIDINLNSASGSVGNDTTFYIFGDLDGNGSMSGWGTCNPGPTAECISPLVIARGNRISRLCVMRGGGASDVCTDGSSGSFRRVAITFLRPDPAPQLRFMNGWGSWVPYAGHRGVKIEITSPKGEVRTVVVYTTGQISVE